jgi:tyrosyl-tRNA synthetase
MKNNERDTLIRRNTVEIITEAKLKNLLKGKKRPVVYCGYEPSGPLHLGHFVTILKLMDLAKAGFKVKILLADVHAFLNRKGNEEKIKKEIKSWTKTIKAIGLDCEIVLGSSFQFEKNYVFEVIKLAQETTINRGLRSMQEIARDIKNATISQLWYPLMQVVDIKHLGVDVALGGIEQRKVHMIGKDLSKIINYDFIALHTPLITSLKGPEQKMSSSVPGTMISVTDSLEQIKKILNNAYCPVKKTENNPVLQIAKLIIFPKTKKFVIKRSKKFGGDTFFPDYTTLSTCYAKGELHPLDLKNAVAQYLEKIIAPIRKNFK